MKMLYGNWECLYTVWTRQISATADFMAAELPVRCIVGQCLLSPKDASKCGDKETGTRSTSTAPKSPVSVSVISVWAGPTASSSAHPLTLCHMYERPAVNVRAEFVTGLVEADRTEVVLFPAPETRWEYLHAGDAQQ
ncbi:hypothetical protein INR49_003975 [Caranx melampygus]|nr:hypothetical protein INR49_003975 [Caranx melampygus]